MVKQSPYTPAKGDLIWLDFSPQAGREQAGQRPALVLSPLEYNKKNSPCYCLSNHQQSKGISL